MFIKYFVPLIFFFFLLNINLNSLSNKLFCHTDIVINVKEIVGIVTIITLYWLYQRFPQFDEEDFFVCLVS